MLLVIHQSVESEEMAVHDRDLRDMTRRPLLAQIHKRCVELREEENEISPGSPEKKKYEKLISELEEYRLPKPDASDLRRSAVIVDERGRAIAHTQSLRLRHKEKRRGRPEEYRIQARAALEDWLADSATTWPVLTEKYKFGDVATLERAVRRLKRLLERAGIDWAVLNTRPPGINQVANYSG